MEIDQRPGHKSQIRVRIFVSGAFRNWPPYFRHASQILMNLDGLSEEINVPVEY